MTILVTGGAGYIGSHAVQRLLRDGRRVVALDNLFRGHLRPMDALAAKHQGTFHFVQGDVNDRSLVAGVLRDHAVTTVMHFAAQAYVGESVNDPLRYYRNNVGGLISLLEAVDASHDVARCIFSSSCSTYGDPPEGMIPIPETCPQRPVSPYGRTKLMGEEILRDFATKCRLAKRDFAVTFLRYFNVCGCDRSGLLGEDHTPESHLVPLILQTAMGLREKLAIFGTDYPTPDGTCIRDYVHVEDLVAAHVLAMDRANPGEPCAYNVGIGRGHSVREVLAAAERVTGKTIRVVEEPRRAGDPPRAFADPARIRAELGWQAQITDLETMIASAWNWFQRHPKGYAS